jgi:hypothetical protein
VAARSTAWFYGHSLVENVDSNLARGMTVCLFRVVCCQVEVFDGLIPHPEDSYRVCAFVYVYVYH